MSSPGVTRNSAPDPRRLKPEHWQGLLSQDVQESQRAINLQHKEVAQHAAISKTYDPGLYRKNAKKPSGDPIPTRSNAASGYPASVFDAWAGRLSLGELRGKQRGKRTTPRDTRPTIREEVERTIVEVLKRAGTTTRMATLGFRAR